MVLQKQCTLRGWGTFPPNYCTYLWHVYLHVCTFFFLMMSYICMVCFRSIHHSLDQLFLTSPTCCPVSACRYFQLQIIFGCRHYYYFAESVCFSCLYSSPLRRQVYYTYRDSCRQRKCPFQSQSLAGECDR